MPTKRTRRSRTPERNKTPFELFLDYAAWLRSTFQQRMAGEDVPVPKEYLGHSWSPRRWGDDGEVIPQTKLGGE